MPMNSSRQIMLTANMSQQSVRYSKNGQGKTESVVYNFPKKEKKRWLKAKRGNDAKQKEEKSKPAMVSVTEMFKFASSNDKLLLCIGLISAFLSGGIFPSINIFLGRLLDIFVENEIGGSLHAFPECFQRNSTRVPTNSSDSIDNRTTMFVLNRTMSSEFIFEKCKSLCFGLLILGLLQFSVSTIMVITFNIVAENQVFKIRTKFMKALLRQDIAWFDANKVGDFASRISENLTIIQDGIGTKLISMISMYFTSITFLIVSLYFGWKLTLATVATMPIIIIALGIVSKIQAKLSYDEVESYGKAGSVAEEVISSIKTVAAFSGEKKEIDRYESSLVDAEKNGIKRGFFTGLGSGIIWICIFSSYGLVFWYGSKLIIESRCAHGDYVPSTLLIVFFCVTASAIFAGQTSPYMEAFTMSRGAAKELFNIIAREPAIDIFSEEGEKPPIEGRISFKDVHFSYPSRPDALVLNNFSFEAVPGETVALVGPSGCGKSTIVHLLQRFYDTVEGRVEVDGRDIRKLNLAYLRKHIGVVGQEPVLFDNTIVQNIQYGCDQSTFEDVVNACKVSNAHNFIMALPDKYNTQVGESGTQLSGGQKQRIAIARAIIQNPKILLLDEATGSLDFENEVLVQEALNEARFGRTTIVIAHRLSTIKNANKIITIEDGKVKESGTHNDLMKSSGLYYQLVTSQTDVKGTENSELVWIANENCVTKPNTVSVKMEKGVDSTGDRKREEELNNSNPDKVRLIKMALPEWPYAIMGTVGCIILGASLPIHSIFIGSIFGSLSEEKEAVENRVPVFTVYFVILGIINCVAANTKRYCFAVSGERTTARIRKLLFTTAITQEISWFDDKANGTAILCSQLSTDASSIKNATSAQLDVMSQALSTFVAAACISLYYNVKFGLVVLACLPILVIGFILERKIEYGNISTLKGMSSAVESATKIGIDAMQIRTVASLHLELKFYEEYASILMDLKRNAKRRAYLLSLAFGIAQTTPWFCYAISMYYGSYLITSGELYYGDLFAVLQGIFSGGVHAARLAYLAPNYEKAKISAVRILKLLDTPSKVNNFTSDGKKLSNCSGNIVFSNVHFNYPARPDAPVLKGVNLEVNSGQTVALVGASGCGKTTCVQLLERFYDVTKGQLKLDGINVEELNVNWLRSQIGVVSQEPVLFGYSIAENIAYGDNSRHVSMEEIIEAAKIANIHTFITSLPAGYETDVGPKGTQLSGGQKQRIAIARAVVRNPRILLMDEATSALDIQSEMAVQQALDKAREGRTCLTIAHRLSTVQNADNIAVVHDGQVVERGTHQDLMSLQGVYYNLYSKSYKQ